MTEKDLKTIQIESLDDIDEIKIESLDVDNDSKKTKAQKVIKTTKKLELKEKKVGWTEWASDKLTKILPSQAYCIKCYRTEKYLTGSNKNTSRGISIFSPEQLCIDCEIRLYPGRFHGCGFCKRPIREKFSCSICSNGFIEWVKTVIQPIDSTSRLIRMSASRLLNKSVYNLPIEDRQFILRTDDGLYKWPGFYAGITDRFSSTTIDDQKGFFPVWIIPNLTKKYELKLSDFSLTNLKSSLNPFDKILFDILEKNEIYLYSDIQINSETFSSEQIKIINPYDTRVIRK